LPSLLITPVQRIPRYELLLRELIKVTPENHKDFQNLLKAKEHAVHMNQFINEKQKEHENKLKLQDIQNTISTPAPLMLTGSNRLYIRDGPLKFTKNGQDVVNGHVYLFNDMIILTRTTKGKKGIFKMIVPIKATLTELKSSIIEKPEKPEKPETRNEYIETITLEKNISVQDETDLQFNLLCDSQKWTFICDTPQERTEWHTALSDAIETVELHGLIDEMNENNAKHGFVLLNASFGWLKSDKHTSDVTSVILDIISKQGGDQLILNSGPKGSIFGNPTKHKHKQLLIIYSVHGAVKRKIFQEYDPVTLDLIVDCGWCFNL